MYRKKVEVDLGDCKTQYNEGSKKLSFTKVATWRHCFWRFCRDLLVQKC